MTLHFLNVGNGDCTIIELPDGNLMMVDICNGGGRTSEKTDPIRYLNCLRKDPFIFLYVQTHPDMDHMDGLAALVQEYYILNFGDTPNEKPRPDFSSSYAKGTLADWNAYEELRKGAWYSYRSSFPISVQGADRLPYKLYVLHPTERAVKEANEKKEWNNAAYVLLLREGNFKVLIAGDIDDGVWEELYNWASQDDEARSLVSGISVFKVSHHGRRSGYCGANWLNLTKPKEIVISKGSVPGKHSAYGNYYNYKKGAEHLWLTSEGDVVCRYESSLGRYSISYARET